MSTRPRVVRTKRDSFEKGNSKEHKETEGSFDTFAVSLKAVFKGTKRGISPIWNIYKESFFERLKKGGNVGDFSHVLEEKRGCHQSFKETNRRSTKCSILQGTFRR